MVQTPVHRKAGLDRTETACRDRPVPYREDNMKVLIWVGVFLGVSLVQALLRNLMYAGMLPMIPGPLIFYGIASFLAYRLCDRWEYNHSKGKSMPRNLRRMKKVKKPEHRNRLIRTVVRGMLEKDAQQGNTDTADLCNL